MDLAFEMDDPLELRIILKNAAKKKNAVKNYKALVKKSLQDTTDDKKYRNKIGHLIFGGFKVLRKAKNYSYSLKDVSKGFEVKHLSCTILKIIEKKEIKFYGMGIGIGIHIFDLDVYLPPSLQEQQIY